MKPREIMKILKDDGWYELKRKPGSHMQMMHPIKPGKITVSDHGGEIPPGTVNSILKKAGLK
jgi:predicted RNA binding protein YcfA (HicA-like mRNA interferase family)